MVPPTKPMVKTKRSQCPRWNKIPLLGHLEVENTKQIMPESVGCKSNGTGSVPFVLVTLEGRVLDRGTCYPPSVRVSTCYNYLVLCTEYFGETFFFSISIVNFYNNDWHQLRVMVCCGSKDRSYFFYSTLYFWGWSSISLNDAAAKFFNKNLTGSYFLNLIWIYWI